mmetsp:Transcript_25967/g.60951  ORF Transcript_25967/g.60951 Transcript_25967/m.60951 type:complete len:204 (+) Transcript_25967:431-1042(+)
MRILPASPTRVGEAGGIGQGHGHHRLLGHPGGIASPPVAGGLPGNPDHPAVHAQAQAEEGRERVGEDRPGLPARRAERRGHPQVPRVSDPELRRKGEVRGGRLRQAPDEGRALRPPAGRGLHHQDQDLDDPQVVVGGVPQEDPDGRGPPERQERGARGGALRRPLVVGRRRRRHPDRLPVRGAAGRRSGRPVRGRLLRPPEAP